jgi:hypothetical protein
MIRRSRQRETIMSDTVSAAAIATSQDEKIRQRAYEIWESEGRTGNPEDHWFRAQRELDDQVQERSDAMVEDAPPAAAAEASSAATGEP